MRRSPPPTAAAVVVAVVAAAAAVVQRVDALRPSWRYFSAVGALYLRPRYDYLQQCELEK